MCKHIAATLYAIGAKLDENPENLFLLRHVDQAQLISAAGRADKLTTTAATTPTIDDRDLSSLFGIDIQPASKPAKKMQKQNKNSKAVAKKVKKTRRKKKNTPKK